MQFHDIEILLVEDNPADAELTLDALTESKVANKIHHVLDGQQALDFIFAKGAYSGRDTNKKPKVILLDLKLPKVNGLEVLRIIKDDPHTKTIPVVVLTSSKEEKDLIESYKLGVNSFVTKPVDFDAFVKAVTNLGLYWLILNEHPDK
jgi:CheY-like chemotaxis protein